MTGQEKSFKEVDALKKVEEVFQEIKEAVKDKNKTLEGSVVADLIKKAQAEEKTVFAKGVTQSVDAIGNGAHIMVSPISAMIGLIFGMRSVKKEKELEKAEKNLYDETKGLKVLISQAIKEETDAKPERKEYLSGLEKLLKVAEAELEKDIN